MGAITELVFDGDMLLGKFGAKPIANSTIWASLVAKRCGWFIASAREYSLSVG